MTGRLVTCRPAKDPSSGPLLEPLLNKICIILDTSLLGDEIYMPSDSFVFYHPLSLTIEEAKRIVGNMLTYHNILTALQTSSVPVLVDTAKYKVGMVKIFQYFLILSGPIDMSNERIKDQIKLFVESISFFLGPLNNLSIQYSASQVRQLFRKAARHIVTCVIPDRGVTFRNHVGYLPSKASVPLECQLRCSTLLDSLGVHGGVVLHDRKIVYTDLDSSLLAVLQGLEESSVPVEKLPTLEKVTVVRVWLTADLWAGILERRPSCESEREPLTETQIDEMLENLAGCPVKSRSDSVTPESITFEFVSLDIPEETICSGQRLIRSMSSQHSRFSLINELFDSSKARRMSLQSPLKPRSNTVSEINYGSFQDSVESHGSELPGNSLNYKLMMREGDSQSASSCPSTPSCLSAASSPPGTPSCPQRNPKSLPCDQQSDVASPTRDHPSNSASPPRNQPSDAASSRFDQPSDAASSDSVYHETVEYSCPLVTSSSELRMCELLVLSRVNTTVILLGDNLSGDINKYWSACLLLLGDVDGYFNVEVKPKAQKTTQGVNSFVFSKETKSLLFSNAGKTSPDAHTQIKFCKAVLDREGPVEMMCVQGLKGATVVKNSDSACIFLTSPSLRASKLADNIAGITGRNFDSVFL